MAGLLELLSNNKFVSGQEIASELKISRAAVHKQIELLRKKGYEIQGRRKQGYSLVLRPDLIAPAEVSRRLDKKNLLGREIKYFSELGSTQSRAKEEAENGTPEGLLIIAESQSSGYGRLSRKWASPPLGLWFSLVLRPKLIPSNVPQLTLVFSLAICRALKRFRRINPEIKWPNDIFLGNKKLGGVITEMSAESDGVRWLVLGAGINVNNEIPRSLLDTAVSILAATGGAVDRAALLAGIINDFDAMYRTYTVSGFGGFAAEYNENSLLKGKRVTVDMLGEVISGTVLGIDDSGFLLVKRDNGETRKIIAGDVTLKGW